MAKKREPAPLKGSHRASPLVAEAIRQLLRTKAKQALLKRRATLLKKIIMDGGCGLAHGYRAYISPVKGSCYQRTVRVKAHDELRLVAVASPE